MQLPENLQTVLHAVRNVGQPRLVGGCVRDWLLGLSPKDFDIEVPGTSYPVLIQTLAPFGTPDVVGRSFGVVKLRMDGVEYDFSLPRRESKTGAGHRGFMVEPEPDLTDADSAARRDFTINSIAWDPFTGTLIDPFHGERDLRAGVLRHTSAAFVEDPLRVLRAFQLAGRFDFTLASETTELCRTIKASYRELPVERVWGEWAKWSEKSRKPSRGLDVLVQTEWIEHFPEIAALPNIPQDPEWHPEGDVFTHTRLCCDALVSLDSWKTAASPRRRYLLLAVLAHDLGKATTTQFAERRGKERWISPGHEAAGGPLAESFLHRIGAPREVADNVRPLVLHHLAHHSGEGDFTDSRVRRLARKLLPATIDDLCIVMRADHDGRPPLRSTETLGRIEALRGRANALAVESKAPHPIVLGRHLLALGYSPGPGYKTVLDAAFEAQLEGAFSSEPDGLAWLRNYLQTHSSDLT